MNAICQRNSMEENFKDYFTQMGAED